MTWMMGWMPCDLLGKRPAQRVVPTHGSVLIADELHQICSAANEAVGIGSEVGVALMLWP